MAQHKAPFFLSLALLITIALIVITYKYLPPNSYIFHNLLCGFLAGIVTEICTMPFDTAKVRLQIQGEGKGTIKYKGMFHTIYLMTKKEGFRSLYNGLDAGIHRQLFFTSFRLVFYDIFLMLFVWIFFAQSSVKDTNLFIKVITGLASGGVAIAIANPVDMVKIRLQNEGSGKAPRRYKNAIDAYKIIYQQEGLSGLWVGVFPNIIRNSVKNAAELASYYQFKEFILGYDLMSDTSLMHILCGFFAGVIASIIANPIEVVKTRLMNKVVKYNNAMDCLFQTVRNEGIFALYKGFSSHIVRTSLFNALLWFVLELFRELIIPH